MHLDDSGHEDDVLMTVSEPVAIGSSSSSSSLPLPVTTLTLTTQTTVPTIAPAPITVAEKEAAKAILEQATRCNVESTLKQIEDIQKMLKGRKFSDSAEIVREAREARVF